MPAAGLLRLVHGSKPLGAGVIFIDFPDARNPELMDSVSHTVIVRFSQDLDQIME
jgi:hypothetical protein